MKGTSKVIMGATLIMVLSLAIVLGLILVLLAELYCSLLVRRRQLLRNSTTTTSQDATNSPSTQSENQLASLTAPPAAQPLFSRLYSHGVLHAPRNFLFPSLSFREDNAAPDLEKTQSAQLHQFLGSSQPHYSTTPASAPSTNNQARILSSLPTSPNPASESQLQPGVNDLNGSSRHHLVYISNPIFDGSRDVTPYATPDTSPSRLGNISGSSDDEEEDETKTTVLKQCQFLITPPLTPMKELPAQACSVSLRNIARSLGTPESETHSNNGAGGSTSSSDTPCTSPSW